MGGALTLSLDFELYWGSRDHRRLEDCRARILGGRKAVPRLLELFGRYGIRATWATVGLMFLESGSEAPESLPKLRPFYADARLNPYSELEGLEVSEEASPEYFAASLIRAVAAAPGQELATHTFSHYYCLERGQTREQFLSDLEAARGIAERKTGLTPRSLVFPRNQFNGDYLEDCARAGIRAYRGNPRSWLYEPRARGGESPVIRALRLADSYLNLTGHHGHAPRPAGGPAGPVDVPASRFLRPCSRRLAWLEGARLARIHRDLEHCARHGLLYHLWWHPENFGAETERNLDFLEAVLRRFAELRGSAGMRSLTMGEAAEWLAGGGPVAAPGGERAPGGRAAGA